MWVTAPGIFEPIQHLDFILHSFSEKLMKLLSQPQPSIDSFVRENIHQLSLGQFCHFRSFATIRQLSCNVRPQHTFRYMESLGVKEGWNCLEVGGGGGSVARWLSAKSGKTGRVLVTDINPLFLNDIKGKLDNMDVQLHDITGETGIPKDAFDLAHARLVLIHLAERERALSNMIATLKSGGVILIEDFDMLIGDFSRDYHPKLGVPPTMSTELYRKTLLARNTLLQKHGADLFYARRLYSMLRSNGLNDVGFSVGGFCPWQGGTPGAQLNIANTLQSKEEIIANRLMSEKEFEDAIKIMRDPEWTVFSPLMISAWGRKKS